jgi:hypothetical protein
MGFLVDLRTQQGSVMLSDCLKFKTSSQKPHMQYIYYIVGIFQQET